MKKINSNIHNTLKEARIITRPNANTGYWVSFLLPICIIVSYARNPEISSAQYKLCTLVASGFVVSSVIIIAECLRKNRLNIGIPHVICGLYTSSLFYTCLHKGLIFSFTSGFFTTFSYFKCLPLLLKLFPQCFTFGEGSLVVQAAVMFVYMTGINLPYTFIHTPTKTSQISDIILQVGIMGIAMLCLLVYKIKMFRKPLPFYTLSVVIIFTLIFLPLHVILKRSPVLWILQLLTDNIRTIKMILYWLFCSFLAVLSVGRQIQGGRKASSVVRKIFHILAVAALLPGLIDQCSIVYLATGVVFAIFVALEMLRELNLPPLGSLLQDGFTVYSDEKDVGGVALTPIYLLIGCSVPFWIHPESCDVTNSAGFHLLPLISGLLSVGIGDTMASVCGIHLGKYKWPGTKKTIEGTLASIVSQFALIYVLIHFGYIMKTNEILIRCTLAVLISSIVEAKTDQVDNLVLPLITYIILV